MSTNISSSNHVDIPSCSTASSSVPNQHNGNRRGDGQQRNRRFLANMQASLGNGIDRPKPHKSKALPKTEVFAFNDLSEALDRIKLADSDVQISLSDIRPYLISNITKFNGDEIVQLCECFCDSALHQTNAYYVVDLCVDFIGNSKFSYEMSECLKRWTSKFLSFTEEEAMAVNVLPEYFAQLATARWPRGRDKSIESLNPILYTVISTVMGWMNFINECVDEDDEEELDDEKLALVVRCASGLCTFCMVGQRSIWLNFPDLFDDVYASTKHLLTSNIRLSRSLKASLLQLHVLLSKWSLSNARKYTTAGTQTIYKPN